MPRLLASLFVAAALGAGGLVSSPSVAQTRTPSLPAASRIDSVRTSAKAEALLVRGLTQAYVGNHVGAIEHYQKALDHASNAPALLAALADAHAAQDDATSALYYARQAVRYGSESTYTLQLADLQRSFGRLEAAASTYTDVLDAQPNHPHALQSLGQIQRERGRTDAAIDTYETLVEQRARPQPNAWTALSDLYEEVGNSAGVERSLQALIDQTNDPAPYQLRLGRFYMDEDRLADAEATLRALLRRHPGHAEAATQLYDVYERSGRAEQADSLVQQITAGPGGSPDQLVSRAQYLLRSPSGPEAPDAALEQTARRLLDQALATSPRHPEALQTLGRLQFDTGRYAAAGSTLTRALEQNPRAPNRWTRAATAYLYADRPQTALDVADEGLLLFPGRPSLIQVTARALALVGRPQESLQRYEEVLGETDSSDALSQARLHARIGLLHRRLGNDTAASDHLDRAWALAPREPGVAAWVAYDRAVRGVELDRARSLAEDVLSADSTNVAALHALGLVHREQGDLQAAASHLQRAVDIGPASPALLDHLGDVYAALGRTSDARRYWQRALDRDPNRPGVKEKLSSDPK